MSKIIQKKTRILSNIHLAGRYYKLVFNIPAIARTAQPGQFITLRLNQDYKPLLRRPFSIHRINPKIEILYELVGMGTELLSRKKPGQYLDVLGPLGNGFNLTPNVYNSMPVLIGGGIGIAPLLFLAQRLKERKSSPWSQKPLVLIGAKNKREILSQKEFANLGLNVRISTDDGSVGFNGKATGLLRYILRTTHNTQRMSIYACGPKPMLSEIAIIAKQYNIPAQISLDEYMACGLGVCLGCMIQTKEGQRLVCIDGPVFDVPEIKWYNK